MKATPQFKRGSVYWDLPDSVELRLRVAEARLGRLAANLRVVSASK